MTLHLPLHSHLVHPRTGLPLRALAFRPDGTPLWPMMGGSGEEDDANDVGDSGDTDEGGDSGDSGADDWKAKFEAQQRINRQLEKRTRATARELDDLKAGKKPADKKADDDAKVDVDEIKAAAKAEAALEALHGRVEDKIEAKARAFADPEDAVAVLLRAHEINDFIDDGKVDVDAIADALKELGEKKPHLLAQGGKRFQGGADQGSRKETKGRAKNLGEAIARHYES